MVIAKRHADTLGLRRAPAMISAVFHPHRLQTRIFAVYLTLLLAVQALSYWVIERHIDRNARQAVRHELLVGEKVLQRLLDQQEMQQDQALAWLAQDLPLQQAWRMGSASRMQSVLDAYASAQRLVWISDSHATVLASRDPQASQLQALMGSADVRKGPRGRLRLLGGRVYAITMWPMQNTGGRAWVAMASPVDTALLHETQVLSGIDAALLAPKADGHGWQLLGSTLADTPWPSLDAQLPPQARPEPQEVPPLHLAQSEYSARLSALSLSPDSAAVYVVLLRSVDQAVAPYRELKLSLLGLALGATAIFTLVGLLTARRITAPLRALSTSARQLGRGNYGSAMSDEFDGEIGELAQSFESMRRVIRAREGEIRRMADHDPITDLPNREQFRRQLTETLQRKTPADPPSSVLLLDLDRFKQINDVLGHRFGDRLLRVTAQRLRAKLSGRRGSLLARLSGDEFAIMLPAQGAGAALELARAILDDFERPVVLDGKTVDVGAGMGVAAWPEHAGDADALLSRAELAMNAAKQRQSGVEVYLPEFESSPQAESLTLLGELRTAIDERQLRLFLQPKVNLRTGKVVGAEALVRWQHPERGVVQPMGFVPFAEQTGFVRMLTKWMIDAAARCTRQFMDQGLDLKLAINVSTRDLNDAELPARLQTALSTHRLDPRRWVLEITESAIIDDPERALHTLEQLHAMGLRLSIDDFGTGYASLSYLKSLPVQELKVDRSFVRDLTGDEPDAKIVQSTIELAHSLGLSVVAEGVESVQTWRALVAMGCDEAQGHLIARPMPAEQFVAWVGLWSPPGGAHTPGTEGPADQAPGMDRNSSA